jgi:hypothetical protein
MWPTSRVFKMAANEDGIPSELSEVVVDFGKELDNLEQHVAPLLQINLQTAQKSLSPIERAKLNVALGYAINSLFHSMYPACLPTVLTFLLPQCT